jgi:hypothetical protein
MPFLLQQRFGAALVLLANLVLQSQAGTPPEPAFTPPNCTIHFREEGSYHLFHTVKEIEPGTFVVHFNTTKSSE